MSRNSILIMDIGVERGFDAVPQHRMIRSLVYSLAFVANITASQYRRARRSAETRPSRGGQKKSDESTTPMHPQPHPQGGRTGRGLDARCSETLTSCALAAAHVSPSSLSQSMGGPALSCRGQWMDVTGLSVSFSTAPTLGGLPAASSVLQPHCGLTPTRLSPELGLARDVLLHPLLPPRCV